MEETMWLTGRPKVCASPGKLVTDGMTDYFVGWSVNKFVLLIKIKYNYLDV